MLSLLFSITIKAQVKDLDPVTITASMHPTTSSETGRNILVIKGDAFANLPVHSLDELLRYVPGMEVQVRGPFGSQSDISLRGGTFQQTLVIIDGVRVNDPNTGHFAAYIPIAPSEIERIEVLKGASSALYGSEAVGGVINIITKTFATQRAIKKLNGVGQLSVGEFGLYAVNAGVYAANEKGSLSAGVLSNNTTGQAQRGIRGFVNATTVSVSAAHYFANQWKLSLRSAYDTRKFAAQNFYTASAADTAQETVNTFWNQAQLVHEGRNNTFRFQAGYKGLKDSFSFNSKTPSNQNKTELWQAVVTNEIRLSPKTSITPGLQFINKGIISNDRGNHSNNLAAAFLILNQQVGTHFFAAPSARIEWNEAAGWELVPQINLTYKIHQLTLRGSAGKTVRDADFTERYNNYNKTIVSSGQRLGNPDLVAEHSFSYEGGADYLPVNNLKISATFFQRFHKKLIDYIPTPYSLIPRKINLLPTGSYAFAQNIASVTTTGFETDVQFSKPLSTNNNLQASAGFVWLDSKSSDTVPSLYISSHAKFQTNFMVQYTHRQLQFSLTGLYKKRSPQKAASPLLTPVSADYFLLNAKGEVAIIKQHLTAFAEVDNIFNRHYTDLLGALLPGRWFSAGIKISLGSNE